MTMPDHLNIVKIVKEPGLIDLPMSIRGPFAKALRCERQAGHTTEEANNYIDAAVKAEEKIAKRS